MQRACPPRWSRSQLDVERERALTTLLQQWGERGTQEYKDMFGQCLSFIRHLFQATNDLLSFEPGCLVQNPELIEPSRFLSAPPISQDDLETLAGGGIKRGEISEELAQRIVSVMTTAWDPFRFPWLEQKRKPTVAERRMAIHWTASIWAIEKVRTRRRMCESREQQDQVIAVLKDAGFQERKLSHIDSLNDLSPKEYGQEAIIAGAKCDIPVRLRDGRLLAIECKASNSAINSVKRLVREAGGKSLTWQSSFGDEVIPAVVLSGIYKLKNLIEVQNQYKVTIFWQHDLRPLAEFINIAG